MPPAAAKVHRASGAILIVQIATFVSDRAAQDFGGGGGAFTSPMRPATTMISVWRPASSCTSRRGTLSLHSIAKCGSTILFEPGRLSQIWNSSTGFGAFRLSSGNISEWTIPLPAVIH